MLNSKIEGLEQEKKRSETKKLKEIIFSTNLKVTESREENVRSLALSAQNSLKREKVITEKIDCISSALKSFIDKEEHETALISLQERLNVEMTLSKCSMSEAEEFRRRIKSIEVDAKTLKEDLLKKMDMSEAENMFSAVEKVSSFSKSLSSLISEVTCQTTITAQHANKLKEISHYGKVHDQTNLRIKEEVCCLTKLVEELRDHSQLQQDRINLVEINFKDENKKGYKKLQLKSKKFHFLEFFS